MNEEIRIDTVDIFKDVEIEIDGEIRTAQVLDYTVKSCFLGEELVEKFHVFQSNGCLSQIRVFPENNNAIIPSAIERIESLEGAVMFLMEVTNV